MIERAKAGEQDAFEALVRRYQEIAFRVAYLITGSAAEAEDAAQDAFIKAYYALARFRAGAPFRPWLLRIVANESRNRRAAAGRRPTAPIEQALHLAAPEGMPETASLAREREETLLRAVNELRAEDRQVIACRYFLDLSEAETADTLGIARGTVKSRLSRALDRARETLAGREVP